MLNENLKWIESPSPSVSQYILKSFSKNLVLGKSIKCGKVNFESILSPRRDVCRHPIPLASVISSVWSLSLSLKDSSERWTTLPGSEVLPDWRSLVPDTCQYDRGKILVLVGIG